MTHLYNVLFNLLFQISDAILSFETNPMENVHNLNGIKVFVMINVNNSFYWTYKDKQLYANFIVVCPL